MATAFVTDSGESFLIADGAEIGWEREVDYFMDQHFQMVMPRYVKGSFCLHDLKAKLPMPKVQPAKTGALQYPPMLPGIIVVAEGNERIEVRVVALLDRQEQRVVEERWFDCDGWHTAKIPVFVPSYRIMDRRLFPQFGEPVDEPLYVIRSST